MNNENNDILLKNPWFIFAVTALGVIMSSLDSGIVNVALPVLAKEFHSPIHALQWTVSGYLLVMCVLLPLFGRLSDIYTRRAMYLAGFVVFTVGSALCGASTSLTQLILFRLIQGVGAALIIANNRSIIMSTFPKEKQGAALGTNSMMVAIGAIMGPTVGGFLIQWLGWRSIFYINLPIGLLGCITGYYILPREDRIKGERFDLIGAASFTVGLTAFLIGLDQLNDWGILSLRLLAVMTLAVVGLVFFYQWERKITYPMMDFSLFRGSHFFADNLASMLAFVCIGFNVILMPFYLQDFLGLSPLVCGLFLFVSPIFIMFFAPVSGRLINRFGSGLLVRVGLGLMTFGFLMQSLHTATSGLWRIVLAQACIGSGYGIFQSPNVYDILKDISKRKLGVANSFSVMIQTVGRVIGTVLAITLFDIARRSVGYFLPYLSKQTLFLTGFRVSLLCAVAISLTCFVLAHKRFQRPLEESPLNSL